MKKEDSGIKKPKKSITNDTPAPQDILLESNELNSADDKDSVIKLYQSQQFDAPYFSPFSPCSPAPDQRENEIECCFICKLTAELQCIDCGSKNLCNTCFANEHRIGWRSQHQNFFTLIEGEKIERCGLCGVRNAELECLDCVEVFDHECCTKRHDNPVFFGHRFIDYSGPAKTKAYRPIDVDLAIADDMKQIITNAEKIKTRESGKVNSVEVSNLNDPFGAAKLHKNIVDELSELNAGKSNKNDSLKQSAKK